MSIVVFDPDSTDDVDWRDRMRHPAAGDPEAGMWLSDTEPSFIDTRKLCQERLDRLRVWMRQDGFGGVLLFDPYNQRYATGTRNMFGYFLRNSTRYFFVPVEGPIILFDYPQSYHTSDTDMVDEIRPSKIVWSSVSGADEETSSPFAHEVAEVLKEHGGGSMKLGMDRCSHIQAVMLQEAGVEVHDVAGDILTKVRAIKTEEEVKCLVASMAGAEAAVSAVREAIKPGISENELFAVMYGEVIRQGGEFIETRLVTSGQRTNPWFQETSGRKIRPGELVALDTDTIGCFGYYSDFSRTFRCGPGKPTKEQKTLYRMAWEQVQHNMDILKPGMTFREVAEAAWKIPEKYIARRYTSVMHGVGMHGETPFIAHAMDYNTYGREGVIEPGMCLSIESYIGEDGGKEGVKLEDEVLITETGIELLSRFPYEEEFLDGPL